MASNGQVHAKVGGVGTWVNPSTLASQRQVVVLEGATLTAQNPAGLDLPLGITFGGAQAGTDVSISAAGIMTINTAGFYRFKFNMSFGRTTAAGEAVLAARLLVNGAPQGFVQGVKLPDENTSGVVQVDIELQLPVATTLQVQIIRDSSGIDNGGLLPLVTAAAGWGDVPSAWVRVTRLIGTTS